MELNQRPIGYEPTALTPELQAQKHYLEAYKHGGKTGIRTLGTQEGFTPLAGEPIRPLWHVSRKQHDHEEEKFFGTDRKISH